ncbi:DUF4142 domain-containing protein [Herbaspirillum aquaticum]|jgi:putative membrane protein|uniref:DUF305 domain-containing protein n=1 Tax=Herbaspirillum aquaticum TaxID=568783 RepID=A0A225SYM1_9BURK|nr:DUF4142 domain-containing protein [Herbaspirillum aquaticum]MBW9333204.1 DUF4142 domain-containing protein [Herbaspirillum sp. RU 5E]OWY36401.1 DUF305 domain-containing protein [Herbaspirillum aquaticum]
MHIIPTTQARLQSTTGRRLIGAGVLMLAGAALSFNAAAESVNSKDKSFMTNAAEAGHAEIEASQIALEKSSNQAVKDYAQKMIDQHTKVDEQLKQLASSKDVTLPTEPSMAQRAKIAILEKLKGNTFDKRYASMIGVSAHEDAVKLFQKSSKEAQDPDVKTFASKTLPGLQEHLQMGRDLKKTVDAAKK